MERYTVLLVEDDENTRKRLEASIDASAELRVVGSAGTLEQAMVLLRREAPDVLVTDLGLPDGSGIDLIRSARELAADTQTIVITVFGDEKTVISAIEAGARGYLLKDGTPDHIVESIQGLLAGGSPISPPIARYLLKRFQEPERPSDTGQIVPRLSDRETEVLEYAVKGFTFPEIAELLSISPHTVMTHVKRIYRKLEVRSRSEAVYEALQLGIVKLEG